jgi:hypothetical protein
MAEFVEPAGSYVFDPATDTVTTYMQVEDKNGNVSQRPMFKATATIFLQWMARGDQCRTDIMAHRLGTVVPMTGRRRKTQG